MSRALSDAEVKAFAAHLMGFGNAQPSVRPLPPKPKGKYKDLGGTTYAPWTALVRPSHQGIPSYDRNAPLDTTSSHELGIYREEGDPYSAYNIIPSAAVKGNGPGGRGWQVTIPHKSWDPGLAGNQLIGYLTKFPIYNSRQDFENSWMPADIYGIKSYVQNHPLDILTLGPPAPGIRGLIPEPTMGAPRRVF